MDHSSEFQKQFERSWTAECAAAGNSSKDSASFEGQDGGNQAECAEVLRVLVVEDNEGDFYLVRELVQEINDVALYRRFELEHAKRLGEAIVH